MHRAVPVHEDARRLTAFLYTALQQGKTLLPAMPGHFPHEPEASTFAGVPSDELLGHLNRQLWLLCLLLRAKVAGEARVAKSSRTLTQQNKKTCLQTWAGLLLSYCMRRYSEGHEPESYLPRRVRTRPLCPGRGCPALRA